VVDNVTNVLFTPEKNVRKLNNIISKASIYRAE